MTNEMKVAQIIREHRDRLSSRVIEDMFLRNEMLREKYGKHYERLVSDVQFHYDYLAESIFYSSEILLTEYSRWLVVFFRDINVPLHDIEMTFKLMKEALAPYLNEELSDVSDKYFKLLFSSLLTESDYQINSFIETGNPRQELSKEYFNLIMHHRRREAVSLLINAIESGVSVQDIYIHVFQACQREIGRLWQSSRLTVAEEHAFTASTQLVISQLYPYLFTVKNYKGKIVAACVGRELHEIGIRMVADILEMDGWNTIYVGANTPTLTLIDTLRKERPDVLALSTTIIPHIKQMREIISKVREEKIFSSLKIIVGGYPFNQDKNLWHNLDSDGYAPDALSAVQVINKLTG